VSLESETRLIEQSQKNSRTAFESLVLKYQDDLFNTVFRLIGNHHDVLDICQETFVRAYQSIKDFRGDASFRTWLYAIAFNQCYTYRNSIKRYKNTFEPYQEEEIASDQIISPGSNPGVSPVENVETMERNKAVQQVLKTLPKDLREVIVLKDIENLSYEEISAVLNRPVHKVRRQLTHARNTLRLALKKYF